MTLALAALVLFAACGTGVAWGLRWWRSRPPPIERRRRKLLDRLEEARAEQRAIYEAVSSGRVTNPVLMRAMEMNLGRAADVIRMCEHELEQLEVDETEGKLSELESD